LVRCDYIILFPIFNCPMSSTSIAGSISIESHSKQIKLLNDYIVSLEKKINDSRESDSTRMMKLNE